MLCILFKHLMIVINQYPEAGLVLKRLLTVRMSLLEFIDL